MPSVKIILHGKPYKDGTHSIMLQCYTMTSKGPDVKMRALCNVRPEQFDKQFGRVINHPNALAYNALIAQEYGKAERRLIEVQMTNRPVIPAEIIASNTLPPNKEAYLLAHGYLYVKRCFQKGMIHTAEKYTSHLERFAAFLGKDKNGQQKDIHMDDLTEDKLLEWVVWLKNNGTKSVNTLQRRMAFIKTLYIDARKRNLTKENPMAFLSFKTQRVRKPKLTQDQVKDLENLVLEGRLNDVRNTFLLQFYGYGTRISDALSWKKSNIRQEGSTWYLCYTSIKTGDLIDIRLNQKAKLIIDYYLQTVPGPFLLPWLSRFRINPTTPDQANQVRLITQIESKTEMINVGLKKIAQLAGIGINLSTHVARHTFANLADSRIADKRKISAALGHSKFSTTELYLDELRQSDVNDAMEAVWL